MICEIDERRMRFELSCAVEAGDVACQAELARHGLEAVWARVCRDAPPDRERTLEVQLVERRAESVGARFIIPGDPEWPEQLGDLAWCEPHQGRGGSPLGLWVRGDGDLNALCRRSVAIVGSRTATSYGECAAAELAADLGALGYTVVSGGAYGIDAAAHRGALAARCPTVAIMARGCDAVYPRTNEHLLQGIARDYGLVSEVPLRREPTRFRFLGRNRLIAALTQATIVVEAKVRSGARNTATWASLLGRPLFALPGPVTSAESVTPHQLIRDHEAEILTCAADVERVVAPLGSVEEPLLIRGDDRAFDLLPPDERQVFEQVPAGGGRTLGEISSLAHLPTGLVAARLEALFESGWVMITSDGRWRAVADRVNRTGVRGPLGREA